MPRPRSVDELLTALGALRARPVTAESREQVILGLAHKHSFVVAKAADVARELRLTDLAVQFESAFARFLPADPPDKGCLAKTALARAALELEFPTDALFRTGVRHVQMEGSFGPPVDAAAELRGLCGMGLVQVRAPDAVSQLIDLLTDREVPARVGAIRALSGCGKQEAVALLRFKAVLGDADPVVIGECLTGLLRLAPRETLAFIPRFLRSEHEAICEEAILALGSSREPQAFEMLRDFYQTAHAHLRPTLLTAIASMRVPGAQEFLLTLVEHDTIAVGLQVMQALTIYRNDSSLREKLAAVVEKRGDDAMKRMLAKEFVS